MNLMYPVRCRLKCDVPPIPPLEMKPWNDVDQLKTSSHMLRHLLEMHENEERSKVEFGMKVLRYTRSSFERQILESVLIQGSRDHQILNRRAEYNRCVIPRLVTKLGEKEMKKWREQAGHGDEKC